MAQLISKLWNVIGKKDIKLTPYKWWIVIFYKSVLNDKEINCLIKAWEWELKCNVEFKLIIQYKLII